MELFLHGVLPCVETQVNVSTGATPYAVVVQAIGTCNAINSVFNIRTQCNNKARFLCDDGTTAIANSVRLLLWARFGGKKMHIFDSPSLLL